ncbi:MHS family alpha-ketoglutarate permease-like MFS transporter [Streptomyces sp. PanSC19]|uniref:MFS transporter n=1 Tax=Streptomyces sp. PanSC19 TaxID=1520455 RepID=UPI000F498FAA|nr:MFS transporter [Streptomyces sp. PanSC19]ROQ23132.1 MHS family alpha-ketoglutarate permease-like MFS transporter [Streptomyces sp. PanSC19]
MSAHSPKKAHRRAVTATVIGNFIESFDWLGYGLFAPLFAAQFFPSGNSLTSILGVFAVLGVGVLMRPLGGILLGRYADRRGRRPALMLAVSLMAGGSLLIGVTPSYAHIGLLAPVLLLVARMAQGVSHGGEWPAAAAYLMEVAPEKRKATYGSLFSLTTCAGAFSASLLGGGLTAALGPVAMADWGWRVPFLVGGVLGLILLVLRTRLAETEVFRNQVKDRRDRGSLRQVLGAHRRNVLLAVLFVAGTGAVGGTWTAVVPALGGRLAPPGTMFWVVVTATALMMVLNVPIGLLADRIGAARLLVAASALFAVTGSVSYLTMTGTFASLLFTYGSGVVYLVCATTVLPKLLTEIFPPEVRALGVGMPNAVTSAVLGGVAPASAAFAAEHHASGWFIAGVMTAVLMSIPASLLARTARPTEARVSEQVLAA